MKVLKSFHIGDINLHMLDRGDSMSLSSMHPNTPTDEKPFADTPYARITKEQDGTYSLFIHYLGDMP